MIPISNRERDCKMKKSSHNNNNTGKKKAKERNLTHLCVSLSYNVTVFVKLYLMNGTVVNYRWTPTTVNCCRL